MLQVIGWTLATGLVWCFVGVIYGKAPSEKKAFYAFYLIYAFLYMLGAFLSIRPAAAPLREVLNVALWVSGYNLFNMIGFVFLKKAMDSGSQGIAWCVTQSSVVIPFLGSILLLGSRAGLAQWGGMALLFGSLALLSLTKGSASGSNRKGYLHYLLLAFLLTGTSQFFQLIPGHLGCSQQALAWRIPASTPIAVFWWIGACISVRSFAFGKVWKHALLYAVVVLAGQALFYQAVDAADGCRMTAVVYPLAVGSCIFLFAVYCALVRHEKISFFAAGGMLLNVAGIVLLSLGAPQG